MHYDWCSGEPEKNKWSWLKAELLQEGTFFLIHLFVRDVLVTNKIEGTLILKLAMVKKIGQRKNIPNNQNSSKYLSKYSSKISSNCLKKLL